MTYAMKQAVESPGIIVAVVTFAALTLTGIMFWRQKKTNSYQKRSLEDVKIPTKWTKVGEIGELILYPLKGAKRKCVSDAQCTKLGLRVSEPAKLALQDRVFMVFNENNEFMNIKRNAKMLLIEITAEDELSVRFSFPEVKDLIVKIPDSDFTMSDVNFYFGEMVKTVDCGDEAATWFSQNLLREPIGLRLGCFVTSLLPARSIDGHYDKHAEVYTKFHSDYLGAYADIASYMLMGEESLKDLNSRLKKPVTEHNFRPNIVVTGSPAFSEDTWDWVKLGDTVILRGFKYCTRCVVTSIDPDTTEKDPTTEPLRTLRKYRQVKEAQLKKLEGNSPVMGLYAGCHQTGRVCVGDPVYISAE